jgi:hypothetical protein
MDAKNALFPRLHKDLGFGINRVKPFEAAQIVL